VKALNDRQKPLRIYQGSDVEISSIYDLTCWTTSNTI
jgi:hypothetical protein